MKNILCGWIFSILLTTSTFAGPLPLKCQEHCVTSYGDLLGVAPGDVPVFSNCQYKCQSGRLASEERIKARYLGRHGGSSIYSPNDLESRPGSVLEKDVPQSFYSTSLEEYEWNSLEFVRRWYLKVYGIQLSHLNEVWNEGTWQRGYSVQKSIQDEFRARVRDNPYFPDLSSITVHDLLKEHTFRRLYGLPRGSESEEKAAEFSDEQKAKRNLWLICKSIIHEKRHVYENYDNYLKYHSVNSILSAFWFNWTRTEPGFRVGQYENHGTIPPRFGDAIIYSRFTPMRLRKQWPIARGYPQGDGHIAIVVQVEGLEELEQGKKNKAYVYLVEQNFWNKKWHGKEYSRVVPLYKNSQGGYSLGISSPERQYRENPHLRFSRTLEDGAYIIGWVRPEVEPGVYQSYVDQYALRLENVVTPLRLRSHSSASPSNSRRNSAADSGPRVITPASGHSPLVNTPLGTPGTNSSRKSPKSTSPSPRVPSPQDSPSIISQSLPTVASQSAREEKEKGKARDHSSYLRRATSQGSLVEKVQKSATSDIATLRKNKPTLIRRLFGKPSPK